MNPMTHLNGSILRVWTPIIFLSLLVLSPGRVATVDTGVRLKIGRALWETGSVWVKRGPEDKFVLVPSPTDPKLGTSFYGIGQSLLFIPFDLAGAVLADFAKRLKPDLDSGNEERIRQIPIGVFYGPFVGWLLWLGLVTLLIELGQIRSHAIKYASLTLFGTTLLTYSVAILQDEIPIATLACWGTVLALKSLRERCRTSAFWAGLFLASTFLFRLNVIFLFPVVLGLLFRQKKVISETPSLLLPFSIGGMISLSILMFFAKWRFQSFFGTGYGQMETSIAVTAIRPEYVWFQLVGFGKGLLILSPIAWLALFPPRGMNPRDRVFYSSLRLALLASAIAYSKLCGAAHPDGSESWGCRFQTHLLFFLAIGLAENSVRLKTGWSKLIIALSLCFSVISLYAPDAYEAFPLAGENETMRRDRLLTQARHGQLSLRFKTLWYSLHGELPLPQAPKTESWKTMSQNYVPNFWGPAYYKKLGGGRSGILIFSIWFSLIGLLVGLLWLKIKRPFTEVKGPLKN